MFCWYHDQQFSPIDGARDAGDWIGERVWPLAVIRAAAGMLSKYTYLARIHNSHREFPLNNQRLADTRLLWSRLCSSEMRLMTQSKSVLFCTKEDPVVSGTVFAGWYSDNSRRELVGWYSITVAPYKEGHRFLLAYGSLLPKGFTQEHLDFMGQRLTMRFVTQEPGSPKFCQTLTRELLATSEDICVAPSHWESFSEERKRALLEWYFTTFEEHAFLSDRWEITPLGIESLVDLF